MPEPKSLPPTLGPVFTYADAIAAGVSPRRLRNSDIRSPFRGGRAVQRPDDIRTLAATYEPLLGNEQHFSHLTAAELLGLWLPDGFRARTLHVTSVFPKRAIRRPYVIGHQTASANVVLSDGLRVSEPTIAWMECASYLEVDDLVVMGDSLVRWRTPSTTLERLRKDVAACSGRRGMRRLAAALSLVRPASASARESMLRLMLTGNGFPEPELNAEIRDHHGRVIAHGDLVYRKFRVIVEYDGDQHRVNENQFNIDVDRLDRLSAENWRTIRVTRQLFQRHAVLLDRVGTALRDGGWRAN